VVPIDAKRSPVGHRTNHGTPANHRSRKSYISRLGPSASFRKRWHL